MPSGSKKRKAAKRRKEQEQQQQQLGVQPPDSSTSPTTGHPTSPQGNGVRKEDDDRMSHDGMGSESGSDMASPTAREVEGEQNEARIESKSEDGRKESESDPPGPADIKLMDNAMNGGEGYMSESVSTQMMEEVLKTTGEVAFDASDVEKDETAPLPPLDPVPHTSVEVPISGPEAVSVEHIRSGKEQDHVILGEVAPPLGLNESGALGTANLVEQPVPVPVSEEVVQAIDVPVDSLEVVESVAVALSDKNKGKLLSLSDATSEKLDPNVESHPGAGSHEITGSSEVLRSAQLGQRAWWMSCCGLFDVIAGANR